MLSCSLKKGRFQLLLVLIFFTFIFVLQAHAASAVLNFSENCTPDILTPYLDGIVSKLLVLLQVNWLGVEVAIYISRIRLYTIYSPARLICINNNNAFNAER